MECLVGESLRDRITARGRLTPGETAKVVSHVCRALARAHAIGLVHRDLKPENIFIARGDDDEVIKILDFGVAKVTDILSVSGMDPTRTGALLGTPYYMSPEQAQGLKTLDHRSDLWSLAVVVFECLTGTRPFTAVALGPLIGKILHGPIPAPTHAAPEVRLPVELDAWMARALTREPEGRFASAKELAEAFTASAGVADSKDTGGVSGVAASLPMAIEDDANLAATAVIETAGTASVLPFVTSAAGPAISTAAAPASVAGLLPPSMLETMPAVPAPRNVPVAYFLTALVALLAAVVVFFLVRR